MGCKTKKDPVPQPSNDVTVHASPEEPIRCDAVIEGEYTAITWSGPSSTSGTGLHFEWASTSQSSAGFIHGPGQVIRLQVDWWGGAESQRVFIFIE